MATALKLRTDIKKLKDALKLKDIKANIKSKLESQLKKSQDELAALKKGKKTPTSRSAVKGTQTALSRLKSLIKKPKYGVYADGQTKDLEEDAVQGAFPKGRRVSKGLKSNQFGSAKENKGKVYYEYRSNRLDVKQPKKKQTYPKLEKGGYMADGGSVKKKIIADGGMMAKGGNITRGKKYISHWKTTSGDKNYDFLEIVDTNATSSRVDYFGKVVKYKIIESSDKKRIGKIEEDTKDTINDLLKNHIWESYASGGMMAKDDSVTKDLKKGDKVKIDMGYGKGVEEVTVMSDFKAGISGIQFVSLKPKVGAPYTITYSKLKKVIKNADGGMMAKGGGVGDIYTKMYRDTYQEKQFNKKIDKKRELDNYATKNKITIDNNNIISVDGEKIGYINKINQKTGQEKTNWDFVKFASGGMMAKGGKLSLSEFAERYDDNEDNNMHSENVVLLAENFGTKQDILDAKTILAKHEAIGSLPYYLMQERDALSNRLYAKYQEAAKKKESDGGMMAHGGEIKKGDMVKVDNPYWHAAMGTDKPVVRKVTMVTAEDVFFKDGSTSRMKYVTKMEAGGVMAEA